MVEDDRTCRKCGKALPASDFEKGTALTLLGNHYCTACAEKKVSERRIQVVSERVRRRAPWVLLALGVAAALAILAWLILS